MSSRNSGNKEVKAKEITLRFQAGEFGHLPWEDDASFPVKANFASAVFTPLVAVDQNFQIKPGIFKSWNWDFKSNSFIFEINEDLKFDRKRTLKIEDVEFAFLKSFLSKEGSIHNGTLREIVGTSKLKVGQNFKSGMCKGIKILSNSKLQIFLKKNNPHFIYSLQGEIPWVSPPEDFKKDLFSYKDIPRGTGSFRVSKIDAKRQYVELEKKRKDLTDKRPDRILFYIAGNPFENKVDLGMGAGINGLTPKRGYTFNIGEIPAAIVSLDFNYDHHLSKDRVFRSVIASTINREKMFEKYRQIIPSYSFIPKKYIGHKAQTEWSENLPFKKTGKFLKAMKNKKVLAFYHGKNGSKNLPDYIKLMQNQLRKAGLSVIFEPREELTNFNDEDEVTFKIQGYPISIADPLSPFSKYIHNKKANPKIAPKKNKIAKKIFYKVKRSSDRYKNSKYLNKLDERFRTELVAIPLGEIRPMFSYNSRIKSIGLENIQIAVDFDMVVVER